MNITEFRKITIGVLEGYFSNKSVLDKLGESNGNLVYDGSPIEGGSDTPVDAYTKTEVNTLLADKANASTTYTKTEVDTALASKANSSTTYSKTEVDSALALKANVSEVIDNTVDNLTNYYKKTETYTKDEVNALVDAIPQLELEVVASLPTTDISTSTIYLVRNSETTGENLYDEYLRINNAWECIGKVNTSVDLSNLTDYVAKADVQYATTADITTIVNKYQFGGSGSGSGGSTGLPVLFSEAGTERQVGWYENSNGLRKPVYEKDWTLNLALPGSSAATSINPTGFADLHPEVILFFHGIAIRTNGEIITSGNGALIFDYQPSDNQLWIQQLMTSGANAYYLKKYTIRYTKTTDAFQ